MNRVVFTFRNGKTRAMLKIQADLLASRGLGNYLTRDMADQPKAEKGQDLMALNRAELHALAKERGLELDGRLGADSVRMALRGAQ
jgi:hypothetical protein